MPIAGHHVQQADKIAVGQGIDAKNVLIASLPDDFSRSGAGKHEKFVLFADLRSGQGQRGAIGGKDKIDPILLN